MQRILEKQKSEGDFKVNIGLRGLLVYIMYITIYRTEYVEI